MGLFASSSRRPVVRPTRSSIFHWGTLNSRDGRFGGIGQIMPSQTGKDVVTRRHAAGLQLGPNTELLAKGSSRREGSRDELTKDRRYGQKISHSRLIGQSRNHFTGRAYLSLRTDGLEDLITHTDAQASVTKAGGATRTLITETTYIITSHLFSTTTEVVKMSEGISGKTDPMFAAEPTTKRCTGARKGR
ncbi:unnamed protein product [Protopolystoma xenopodis]|uniref:Uncharacterized protein n=1 Tax=Protopolystoma xenopodis TaxID=117903 RepID=A0A3S4ZWN4_9PLAT|nr:unnamed protein product [Protopolystoma xenopodis]